MGNLMLDLRGGWRALRTRPGYTFIAILALALGIGANTTIFSLVNAVLLRPLPYPNADQLVWIWETNPGNNIKTEPVSIPNFVDWQTQNQSFEQLTAWGRTLVTLTGSGEPEQLTGAVIAANFFSTFGVSPSIGRSFVPDDNKPGAPRVAIVSHDFWMRRLAGDANTTGRNIQLNGNSFVVVGVAPAGFKHPESGIAPELWLPLTINTTGDGRRNDFLRVVGRLKPGVTLAAARSDIETIHARLASQYPAANAGWTVILLSLQERITGDVSRLLWMLLAAVGFLLLIACANVANLSLARAATRERELAIRSALGARSSRIIRQLLTESTMLAVAGGLAGLALAVWSIDALIALSPRDLPRLNDVTLDWRVLLFTLGVCLITGILFGTAPAFHAARLNLNDSLKDSSRGSTEGIRSRRSRKLIVIVEVALAVVLLFGAGLTLRSFLKLQNVNPGFRAGNVLTAQILAPRSKYPEGPQIADLYDRILERVRSLPGVESASLVNMLPLGGSSSYLSIAFEGRPAPPPEQVVDAEPFVVAPDYFSTLGIQLVRGEPISARDGANTNPVAMINETLARRYYANEDPIGKRIAIAAQQPRWMTIIGIVRDTHHTTLAEAPYPQLYGAYSQRPVRVASLVIRTTPDPLSIVSSLKSQVRSIDPDIPVSRIATLESVLSDSIAQPRVYLILVAIFALVGLLLAAIGIYGVISYSVTQRTGEFGVRLALGASSYDVLRMVLTDGMKLAGIGIAAGLAGAFALSRLIVSVLYGVTSTDVVTLLGVPLILFVVAIAACYIPALRATRVDPLVALRHE
jgi:putative ABC transport system permease protein